MIWDKFRKNVLCADFCIPIPEIKAIYTHSERKLSANIRNLPLGNHDRTLKYNMSSLKEIVIMAWDNVKSQRLRTGITASIIAIGITALVGILTSVSALRSSMVDSFKSFGANVVSVYGGRWAPKENDPSEWVYQPKIEYRHARTFKEKMAGKGTVSVNGTAASNAEVRSEYDKTDPNIRLVAADEDYFDISGFKIDNGRFFSSDEIESGTKVAVVGPDIVKKLFPTGKPLGQNISVNGLRYNIIGVVQSKGSTMGMSQDNLVFIPLQTARTDFPSFTSFTVSVVPPAGLTAADAEFTDNVRVTMRNVRGLRPSQEDNFIIRNSQAALDNMDGMLSNLKAAALIIGLITILGSSIALMNIMLVSVTERTREIGTLKAIGADARSITLQFLIEAIIIGQIGGLIGIAIGILLGNIVSLAMHISFVLPVTEMLLAFAITFGVGVISGYYPARKASRLDPIEALRYE